MTSAALREGASGEDVGATKMGPAKGARTGMWKATVRGLLARKVRLAARSLPTWQLHPE